MNYDFLLIDTGPGIGSMVESMLSVADEAIVVTRPEPTALDGAYGLIKAVIQRDSRYPFHLLVNMVCNKEQGERTYEVMQWVLVRILGYQPGDAGFVELDTCVPKATAERVPFVLAAPEPHAALGLLLLVKRLLGDGIPERSGKFAFLRKFVPKSWYGK